MSKKKPNGSAALADALESAMEEAVERVAGPRFDAIDERFAGIETRLDRVDGTLRMIWRQCGGSKKQHLPIDADK